MLNVDAHIMHSEMRYNCSVIFGRVRIQYILCVCVLSSLICWYWRTDNSSRHNTYNVTLFDWRVWDSISDTRHIRTHVVYFINVPSICVCVYSLSDLRITSCMNNGCEYDAKSYFQRPPTKTSTCKLHLKTTYNIPLTWSRQNDDRQRCHRQRCCAIHAAV